MGLFGSKYPATEKVEREDERLRKLYQEVLKTSGSEELKEFLKLEELVNTDEFKNEKRRISALVFKRTKEFEELRSFNKLSKNRKLKTYLLVDGSQELSDYDAFSKTERYALINDKKQRKNASDLQKFYKFKKSRRYRVYKELKSSALPKEYDVLKKRVKSEEFKSFKAFCENKKRWETTDWFKTEQRYIQLKSNPLIENYVNYYDSDLFDEFKKYEITFEDDFSTEKLDDQKWKTSFLWAENFANGNYSQADQNQGYIDSKNIALIGSKLTIMTRHDEHTARIWDPEKGFVKKSVDYSSGVISSGKSFNQNRGIFTVKLKTSGKYPIGHTVMLSSSKNDQHITLFKTLGKRKSYVGYSFLDKGKVIAKHALIKSFNSSKGYHILRLEWDENILVWKVNGIKVYSCHVPTVFKDLHFSAYSFVDKTKKKTDSGNLVFDWVRAYKHIGEN